MSAILLSSDAVRFKDPCKENAHMHLWWAEGGLIHWNDLDATGRDDEKYGSMTVQDCLIRLKGINDMIGNHRTGKGWNHPSEMTAYRGYIDAMIALCEMAKRQGMPDAKRHVKQMVREIREKRSSRTVVPGLKDIAW